MEIMMMDGSRNVTFVLGGMTFEYDEDKNKTNIKILKA